MATKYQLLGPGGRLIGELAPADDIDCPTLRKALLRRLRLVPIDGCDGDGESNGGEAEPINPPEETPPALDHEESAEAPEEDTPPSLDPEPDEAAPESRKPGRPRKQ